MHKGDIIHLDIILCEVRDLYILRVNAGWVAAFNPWSAEGVLCLLRIAVTIRGLTENGELFEKKA
jgi:hypothetical protein